MNSNTRLQKRAFRRAIAFHSLKSSGENLDLLSLAMDDKLIFEMAYSKVVRLAASSNEVETISVKTDRQELEFACCSEWLSWLSKNRAELLIEIHSIVEDLGGIEVADYLIQDSPSICCSVR